VASSSDKLTGGVVYDGPVAPDIFTQFFSH